MSDFIQPSLNLDLKQDASLSDFRGDGFLPVLNAIRELGLGNLRELFIIGAYGYGKTHLLNAIAWEAQRLRPDAKVVYLTAERFLSACPYLAQSTSFGATHSSAERRARWGDAVPLHAALTL